MQRTGERGGGGGRGKSLAESRRVKRQNHLRLLHSALNQAVSVEVQKLVNKRGFF